MAKKIVLYIIVFITGVSTGLIGEECARLGYEEGKRERSEELKQKFSNIFS